MTKLFNDKEIFGEDDIIYSYTREEAIEDGLQFQIPLELTKEAGYIYPVYCTDSVNQIIDNALISNKMLDRTGILWDVLATLKIAIRLMVESPEVKFHTIINGKDYEFFSQVSALDIDDPKPAITIMRVEDL